MLSNLEFCTQQICEVWEENRGNLVLRKLSILRKQNRNTNQGKQTKFGWKEKYDAWFMMGRT